MKACCSWGSTTIIPAKDYVGGPVPLLRNPHHKLFKQLAVANIILTVLVAINITVQAILT